MKAIILAAGRGSRLGPLTENNPKCLVRLAGRPLLEWQIDALRRTGISEIAIVTGYRADLLEGFAQTIFHNPRWTDTNMVRSLAMAAPWLRSGSCIVSYSDIFYSADTVRSLMQGEKAAISISYDPDWRRLWEARFDDPLSDAESFKLGSGKSVIEIGGRAERIEEIEGQYMGLSRFSPTGWASVETLLGAMPEEVGDKLDMTGLLSSLISMGLKLRAVPCVGPWGEVDDADDLAFYESSDFNLQDVSRL